MERRAGLQPTLVQMPVSVEDQTLIDEHERQVRISAGYQNLVRYLLGEPEIELSPDQLSAAKVIIDAGMDRYFEAVDRQVIIQRYGLSGEAPLTLSQVGAQLDRSGERVRRYQVRGLRTLGRPANGILKLREIIGNP